MKISNSKQELARIISENGGWRNGANWAAQDKDGKAFYHSPKPSIGKGNEERASCGCLIACEYRGEPLPNWRHTILSRDEYFHLYPALGELCGKVTEENRHEQVWTNPPTIEQLAADYRDAKDFAERKQQEADDAKADADESLRKLELTGEEIGLLVSPITEKQEPELVIGVQVGDEVECVESNIKRDKYNGMVGRLRTIDESDTSTPYLVDFGNEARIWCHEVKFIRRP